MNMEKKVAVRELGQLLPLDEETLEQIINNSLQLETQSAISKYWLDLLGQSPDALDFIAKMTCSKSSKPSATVKTGSSFAKIARPNQAKAPVQLSLTNRFKSSSSSTVDTTTTTSNAWNQQVPEKQKFNNNNSTRLKKATSTTTSELLVKTEKKSSKQISTKKDKQKKIDNLKDIESVLTMLEVESSSSFKCDCKATIHPLFEVAPNCLNCGKIICVKEGLRPCSFCGSALISLEEMSQIKNVLLSEKESSLTDAMLSSEKKSVERPSSKKSKKITITGGAGVNLWKQQDSLFEKLEKEKAQTLKKKEQQIKEQQELKDQSSELQFYKSQKDIDPDLLKAKQNLENLLNFQTNSAERTKIIDQASDFDIPSSSGLNMWSSSIEKALQLKKQQRQLRKQEKKKKQLTGRGKQVMSISIGKDGKAVINSKTASTPDGSDNDDSDSEDQDDKKDIANLETQLRKNKDHRLEEEFNTVWNPDKDAEKWEIPKYVSTDLISNDDSHKAQMEKDTTSTNTSSDKIQHLGFRVGNDDVLDLDEIVTII